MSMGRTKSKKPTVPSKTKLKKDPGIPKLPSLKERVRNVEKHKARGSQLSHFTKDPDSVMASEPTLSSLALLAAEAEAAQPSEPGPSSSSNVNGKTKEQVRKHYLRTLHKVIDDSDIVILVLDARDPEGCRSRLVEEEVRRRENEGKKLVFVLNKVDLIPKQNAQLWLKHLRHSTPTLPFLSPSSAQHQRTNISSTTAPALLKLLKAYKPATGSVTIGIVGYPNVGKSSLINSLKRSKVCAVAAQPGHTKDLQSIQLERGMRIVDSPGVVFDEDDEEYKGQKKGSVLLRNVVKVEDIDDPIAVVEEILHRTSRETIQKIYNLPDYSNPLEFLTMLALNSGRLLKGGTPDLISAARHVLMDWNHQKIPYFTNPPAIHPSLIPSTVPSNLMADSSTSVIAPGAENVGQAQILTTLSQPFSLEGLFNTADAGAFGGRGGGGAGPDVEMDEDGEDEFFDAEDGMDQDGFEMDINDTSRTSLKRPRSPSPTPMSTPDASNLSFLPNVTLSQPLAETTTHQRQPKRQRKSKVVPAYDAPPDDHVLKRMERSNPLSRKVLKTERKKERKMLKQKMRREAGGLPGAMEVDDSAAGLEFTFMA